MLVFGFILVGGGGGLDIVHPVHELVDTPAVIHANTIQRKKGQSFDLAIPFGVPEIVIVSWLEGVDVVEHDSHCSVMVCDGISHVFKSSVVVIAGNLTAVRYRDEILQPHAVLFVQQNNLTFQQDNARLNFARVCRDFLAANNIAPPPLSNGQPTAPICPPIEHLWDQLDRSVRNRAKPPWHSFEMPWSTNGITFQ